MSKLCYSKWSCRVTKKDCLENCIENSVLSSCHREWLCRGLSSQITVCIQRTASFLWKPKTRNVQQRQLRIEVFADGMRPDVPAVALFRKHTDKMGSSLLPAGLYMHVLHVYPRTYIEVGLVLCSSATAASVYDVKNHSGTLADGSNHVHARKSACEISLNKTSR